MAAPKKPSTHVARQAKKAKALATAEHAGTLDELRVKVWKCLNRVGEILDDEGADPLITLKAVHAFTQAAGCYVRLVEGSEIEARLEALEKGMTGRSNLSSNGAHA